ncbi:MAG: NPCBM/NEW2 domain-containing protein [Candidatus Hydrogenedentes bacterium]|nr:NPCBM/NEW2 domain-containing protein [Candidatus Hydrogenedentota bacterium]
MLSQEYSILVLFLIISPFCFSDIEIYLSDVPENIASISQGWGEIGWDVSAHAPERTGLELQIGGKKYKKGIGHHAPGEIVFYLDKKYKCFKCEVGVQKQNSSNTGSVIFEIEVDRKKKWNSGVRRELDPPLPVEINLNGAEELRLIVKDAGDGIAYDCANWANARLIFAGNLDRVATINNLDIAPFADVVTCDPRRYEGTRCSRTEEFPTEDVYLEPRLCFQEGGLYQVPDYNGLKCIGLCWYERRKLTDLEIEFSGNKPEQIWTEIWIGESPWQGKWHRLNTSVDVDGSKYHFHIPWRENIIMCKGTEKVRWICEAKEPLIVSKFRAYTNSSWESTVIRLENEEKDVKQKALVSIYNGKFLESNYLYDKIWDISEPLILNVLYSVPRSDKGDRTLITILHTEKKLCIAIEDLLRHPCIYVPEVGIFAVLHSFPLTVEDYKKRIRHRRSVLDKVRTLPEQTFSDAMDRVHRPIQNNGPTMLSLACDNNKFIVERNGSIQFNDFFVEVKMGDCDNLKRSLFGGWYPILLLEKECEGIKYFSKTFVTPYGDNKSLLISQFEIKSADTVEKDLDFSISFYSDKNKEEKIGLRKENQVVIAKGDKVSAICVGKDIIFEILDENVLKIDKAPKRSSSKMFIIIPSDDKVDFGDLKRINIDRQFEKTIEYWNRLFENSTEIDIPEPLLNNLIKASQVHCLIAARSEDNGKLIAPWIASMAYGPLESEAHSIIYGMDLMGWNEFSRKSLEFFISKYNDAGYLTTGYTLMGTGWHLWTLAEHYRLTKDKEWLEKYADKISKVCEWIVEQCAKTNKQFPCILDWPLEDGLVPPGVAADWNRFAYRFSVQAHFYAGLYGAGSILKDIGYPSGDKYVRKADELKFSILGAFAWSKRNSPVLPLSSGKWVLPYPSILYAFGTAEEMFPGEDSGRSWAYDVELGAHHLIPLGVLSPLSNDAENMLQHMEDYWFLHSDYWSAFRGEGDYPEAENRKDWFNLGGFSKIQPYYTRVAEIYAMRDEVKPFIRAYFNAIPSLLNTENLSFWEHFHNIGAWNKTHETGWFLVQTRKMFIREDNDVLWLAPFVPSYWLEPENKVSVRNAKTYFGTVSFEIVSKPGGDELVCNIHMKRNTELAKIIVRLRHPQDKLIKNVLVNGDEYYMWNKNSSTVHLFPSSDVLEGKWVINCSY